MVACRRWFTNFFISLAKRFGVSITHFSFSFQLWLEPLKVFNRIRLVFKVVPHRIDSQFTGNSLQIYLVFFCWPRPYWNGQWNKKRTLLKNCPFEPSRLRCGHTLASSHAGLNPSHWPTAPNQLAVRNRSIDCAHLCCLSSSFCVVSSLPSSYRTIDFDFKFGLSVDHSFFFFLLLHNYRNLFAPILLSISIFFFNLSFCVL